jgi:DNA-binding NtrC family response regulator
MKRRRRGLYREMVADFKREVARMAIRLEAGDTKKAAKLLDISRTTLYRLLGECA